MKIKSAKTRVHRLIIAIILLTMMAQFLGEAIDHHFLERNPVHSHMGQINFQHKHGYMDSAIHDHSSSSRSNGWSQAIFTSEVIPVFTLAIFPIDVGTRMDSLRHITSSRILPKDEQILKLSLYIVPPTKPPNID